MKVLFVPGGPGFSSRREAEVLAPSFAGLGYDTMFWDDPWRGEHNGAPSWDAYLDALQASISEYADIDDSLTIIGHSFAVHPVLLVLDRLQRMPDRLVLIAPALDLHDGHRRVVELAAGDFAGSTPADRLRTLLARTRCLFDSEMQEALTIAAEDPLLFRHYWQDEEAFAAFAATAARPEGQFNPNTFFQVLAGLSKHGCAYLHPSRPLDIETLILFGAADPLIDSRSVGSVARLLFTHVDEHTVANCGHWVHLERPDVFLNLVAKASQRC